MKGSIATSIHLVFIFLFHEKTSSIIYHINYKVKSFQAIPFTNLASFEGTYLVLGLKIYIRDQRKKEL
jgi:hypothetical protein